MRLIDAFREKAIEENMKTLERFKEAVETLGMPEFFVKRKEATIEYLKNELVADDFYSGKSYMDEEVIGTPEVKEDGYYFETEKGTYKIYAYTPNEFTRWAQPRRLICKRLSKKVK